MSKGSSMPNAWVVSSKDRGRKSIKNGNVFLNDGEQFEIEMFNPLKKSILAQIKLNGSFISKTGIVIRPGERVYLDCFIDTKKKFTFNTYLVENVKESMEAIEDNGLLEVRFFEEDVISNIYNRPCNDGWWYGYYNGCYNYYDRNDSLQNPRYTLLNDGSYNSGDFTTLSNSVSGALTTTLSTNVNSTIESGRVEGGDLSNQSFTKVDSKFKSYIISSTTIRLLPESRKPHEVKSKRSNNDIESKLRKLKDLLQEDLITQDDYDKKKSELLNLF